MNTTDQKDPGESGLYNRIAVLRAERGISRQQLADAMDVNYQTIGFLERGDYSPVSSWRSRWVSTSGCRLRPFSPNSRCSR